MNKKLIIVAILGLIAGLILAETFKFSSFAEWRAQTADSKREFMWNRIVEDNFSSGPIPNATANILMALPESLGGTSIRSTLQLLSDQYPKGRSKDLHPVGNMVKFKINLTDEIKAKYTGVFQNADFGLARFSSAAPLDATFSQPSMGLKFFRDGERSADVVVQWARRNAETLNFFDKCNTNMMDTGDITQVPFIARSTLTKFLIPTKRHEHSGNSLLTDFNQDGSPVENPQFPFAIVFRAVKATQELCDTLLDGFQTGDRHFPCLEELPIGTELFDIFAVDIPTDLDDLEARSDELITRVGTMVSESEFRRSKFGDDSFQVVHVLFEKELEQVTPDSRRTTWETNGNDEFFLTSGCDRYLPLLEKLFPQ